MRCRPALLLACLLLAGAAPPRAPTPNAPAEAPPPPRAATLAGRAEGDVPAAVGDDPRTRAFLRAVDLDVLGGVLVQDGGRRKPLEAFAREALWRVLNAQGYRGQPPVLTLLSMCFDPAWIRVRVLKAGHPDLARALGRKRVSLADLDAEAYESLRVAAERGAGGARNPLDRAVMELDRRATLLSRIAESLRVLPGRGEGPWIGMGEAGAAAASPAAFNAFVDMGNAYLKRDAVAFNTAARAWERACRAAAPAAYAGAGRGPALERLYYRVQPFGWACLGYFAAFLTFLGAWVTGRRSAGRWAAGLLGLSFLLHGLGIAARVAVAGRPPVSNMYEVVLCVAWAVVACAFAVEAVMRAGVALMPAAALAALGLAAPALFPFIEEVTRTPLPLDPSISQVQAVLKSNYWLTVHVCTITTSYAILFLGFAVGVVYLAARRRPASASLETLDRVAWRVNQLGFLFLTAGIMTGAWWANASWGRYWGWDPKETGSFVAWCLYGAYLHLRRFGFLQARGAAWLTALGFLAILFTMIGVGYFLPGLHSYA